jgi:sigma-B regulation protein RsbU (phosphoserine phosphatase)
MHTKEKFSSNDPKLSQVLREDFRRGDFFQTIRRDYEDMREFFLDDERKQRLKNMKPLKRIIFTFGWLLKPLFLKLTPARRILVVAALVMLAFFHSFSFQAANITFDTDMTVGAGIILLFVLMLELKDKLLARDELEAGRAVQAELMPESSPSVPGWSLWLFTRTANEVGGDLVDFLRLDEQRFGITLADVAGKGLKAALLTAKLQATLRALAPETPLLGTLGMRVNHIFCRDGIRSMFASFVYLEISSNSGRIRFINAGHLPPLVLHGKEIEEMKKGDPAIGLTEIAEYHELERTVMPGEILVIYSDGLTDAINERNEFYGIQRVHQLLPVVGNLTAPQIGEKLLRDVDRFIGEARIFDDLSMVILKREG